VSSAKLRSPRGRPRNTVRGPKLNASLAGSPEQRQSSDSGPATGVLAGVCSIPGSSTAPDSDARALFALMLPGNVEELGAKVKRAELEHKSFAERGNASSDVLLQPGVDARELGRARAQLRSRDRVEEPLHRLQKVVPVVLALLDVEQLRRQLALCRAIADGHQGGIRIPRIMRLIQLVQDNARAVVQRHRLRRAFVVVRRDFLLLGHEIELVDCLVVLAHVVRSEEHTSELQSRENLVCRLLLEKKKE